MKPAIKLLALLFTLAALAGCGDRERSIRYRVTYTFDTPSGERTGSHVLEAYYGPCGGAAMGPGCAAGVRGEAAVIDLGEGKTVFAILARGPTGQNVDAPVWVADETYRSEVEALCPADKSHVMVGGCHIFHVRTNGFPPRAVDPSLVFTMVAFKDINDPASATVVHAAPDIDTVEQTFGQGYAFKGAVVEVANNAEITRGIANVIPGLRNPQVWNAAVRALPWNPNLFLAGTGAFIRGVEQ